MAQKKGKTFDEQLKRLEEIVDILDAGNTTIEEMLKYFEEGMELVSGLRDYLNKAELKVVQITNKMKKEVEEESDEEETED